jgi:hypothetical protein
VALSRLPDDHQLHADRRAVDGQAQGRRQRGAGLGDVGKQRGDGDRGGGRASGDVSAVGCYTVDSNVIEVELDIVKEFEAGKGLRRTAYGHLVYYVGVTLLHELCHWANDGTGASDLTHEKFEQALYGGVV